MIRSWRFAVLFAILSSAHLFAAEELPTIAQKTSDMQKFPGFLTFYWDDSAGKIWLEIDKWDEEILYVTSLPAGVGSNDIGLDRGQLGRTRIVTFKRSGPKILMVQPNYRYRAMTDNAEERQAVEEAFAQSVIWGFEAAAIASDTVLVDATPLLLSDGHGVIPALKRSGQGNYKLDDARSVVYLPRTKNFPQNTEFEAMLTFAGDPKGRYIRQVTPTPDLLTVREHHSFVQLPDDGYEKRKFDPRAGFFGIEYLDYATPIDQPIAQRFISRHRLEKRNPNAESSNVVEPIVYYVDAGAPEPIRSALVDGASWWAETFEAAGFQDAFQVELLPPDADPLDVRYNVIQWVHRATRGWSYGSAVRDPRTGEIIKGHVSLGSLRVRQDFLIAEGLTAPYADSSSSTKLLQEMALARIRQLAAHEVGHTLGLSHNFAASTFGRTSVMDYPHPLVTISVDGTILLDDAYDVGIGEWDKVAIAWGYSEFADEENAEQGLAEILQNAHDAGMYFLSDADARPAGGAHPTAHLWDNGVDPIAELERVMRVRQLALQRFSEKNIPFGTAFSQLQEVLVPIYYFHRYQTEAVAKLVGGLDYRYAVRGDGQSAPRMLSAEQQSQALRALIATLAPENLQLPPAALELIPPRAFGYGRTRELFPANTSVTFDAIAPAEAAAKHVVGLLLHPARASRLVEYHARNVDVPGLETVCSELLKATWHSDAHEGYTGAVQRAVNWVVLQQLMTLASSQAAHPQAAAIAFAKVQELDGWLEENMPSEGEFAAHAQFRYARALIKKFVDNPEIVPLPAPAEMPPGSPIGGRAGMQCGW